MKRARRMEASMADVPLHIVMDIISRLPIRTMMAIRCVCKSLLSLVSDPHFQILHSTSTAPTELFLLGPRKASKTLSVAEYVFEGDSLTNVDMKSNVVFELPNFSVLPDNTCNFDATGTTVTIANSCCGLVCYKGPPDIRFAVVCNPFTREFITFPRPAKIERVCYGLGFSPKDNKFKLLRIIYYRNNVDECVVEIYTFGERGSSWKGVDDSPCVSVSGLEKTVFHEGVLHWDCTSSRADHHAIVTFDFDTERFGELVIPICTSGMSESGVRWSSAVGVFENFLCISGCVGDFVEIWALKEYGQGSWIKIFSIRKDAASISTGSYEPFKYLPNGDVLMFKNFGGAVVCFNPQTGSVKKVGRKCSRSRNGAIFIRPSLASLKVLLGDNVEVHSVESWYRTEAATSSETVQEDVVSATLELQQGGADSGIFGSQDPRPPKDGCAAGQSSSETQKLV